jgi:hypothetical protein
VAFIELEIFPEVRWDVAERMAKIFLKGHVRIEAPGPLRFSRILIISKYAMFQSRHSFCDDADLLDRLI